MGSLPKQRIGITKKTSKWYEQTADALIDSSSFGFGDDAHILRLYEAYNGKLNKEIYSYVENPYNSTKPEKQRQYPARIRNYNIIKPVIDLLLGEMSRRPFNFSVVNKGPDGYNKKQEFIKDAVIQALKQKFINELNAQGADTGVETKEVPPIEEVIQNLESEYQDEASNLGQKILEFLIFDRDLKDNMMDGFFDWLVSGSVFSYKNVEFDDVDYEIVSGLDISYSKTEHVKYIEDADWVVRRSTLSVNEIIDRFHNKLTEDQIKYLESPSVLAIHRGTRGSVSPGVYDDMDLGRTHDVYHIVWKGLEKIGFITSLDEYGEEQMNMVSEFYKPTEDEEVEWKWLSVVHECYKIGENIYFGKNKLSPQRRDISNPSKVKLPYNGKIYSDTHTDNISIVEIGLAFQILYNIFHYRLELSLAKNRDKIVLMDINTIPNEEGWDEEKFMYYVDAHGFGWVDHDSITDSGNKNSFNQWQVLDASLGKYIESQFNMLRNVKEEWEEFLGITRQRKGNMMSSDGYQVTERAVYQSAIMTEDLFRKYETFIEKDYQGLLDFAKLAWKKGKKSAYINSERQISYLEVLPGELEFEDLGVFVTKSGEEIDKLNTLKQFSQSFSQNNTSPSTVAEILDSGNFSKLKTTLKEVEKRQQEYQQSLEQQKAATQEKLEKMQIEDREDQQAFEALQKEMDRQHEYDMKILEMGNAAAQEKENINQGDDGNQKLALEAKKIMNERIARKEELDAKTSIEKEKLRVEREKIKSQEKISKQKPIQSKK